jgi:hypothetical protein
LQWTVLTLPTREHQTEVVTWVFDGCRVKDYTLNTKGLNMDEFADLEQEILGDSKIQSLDIFQIIQSIESDEAPLGFEFTPYEIIWTPASSIGCLLLGIILSPLLIGFFWLWIFFEQRPKMPIMETSYLFQCQYYMTENHSILEYEMLNGVLDATSCKVHQIAPGSYIGYQLISIGDNGNSRTEFTVRTSSNSIQLKFHETVKYAETSRFSTTAGLEIKRIE